MFKHKTIPLTFRSIDQNGNVLHEITNFELLAPALQQHFMCNADRPVIIAGTVP